MSIFWAGPCKPCASTPLLSPHLLTSAICLFCYLHPKICPSVFRNSMRIHCYLKIDNKWGCLLRNCPALVCCCRCCLEFLSAEVWITLEETSLPGGPSQCSGEAMESSRELAEWGWVQKNPRFTLFVGHHQKLASWWTDLRKQTNYWQQDPFIRRICDSVHLQKPFRAKCIAQDETSAKDLGE